MEITNFKIRPVIFVRINISDDMGVSRVNSIDYLRGIMAFSVMIYHYHVWIIGPEATNSEHVLARLGIYAVAIFYILSGTTMFFVYKKKFILSPKWVISFALKRFFRIFPLLWFAIFARILILGLPYIPKLNLLLNLTGIFGFYDLNIAIARLSWSIGVEIVFYTFFPLFLFLITRKYNIFFYAIFGVSIAIVVYYGFTYLENNNTLVSEWSKYMNPLNQFIFFIGGIWLGYMVTRININQLYIYIILLASVFLFVFYPATGDRISLITGLNRMIFIGLSFAICFCFYLINWKLHKYLDRPLLFLGEKSYGIYLIHPIVYEFITLRLNKHIQINSWWLYSLCIIITLISCYISFQLLEKPMIRIGKLLADKFKVEVKEDSTNKLRVI